MQCDNCRGECDPAFTLAAYPVGTGDAVLVDFCSIECLQAWTGSGEEVVRETVEPDPGPGSADGRRPARPASR